MSIANFFRPTSTEPTKPIIVVPDIADIRHTGLPKISAKVQALIESAGAQLVNHYWRWNRRMLRPTLARWDEAERKFLDGDIRCFQEYVMTNFRICTADAREWALDRCIATMIYEYLTSDQSPLPTADWQLELSMQNDKTERTKCKA